MIGTILLVSGASHLRPLDASGAERAVHHSGSGPLAVALPRRPGWLSQRLVHRRQLRVAPHGL